MEKQLVVVLAGILLAVLNCALTIAAEVKRPAEWDKAVEAARKEAKIVIAIPPVNELRREMDNVLKQKFGIEAEEEGYPQRAQRSQSKRFGYGQLAAESAKSAKKISELSGRV